MSRGTKEAGGGPLGAPGGKRGRSAVSREEFDRLAALVRELAARLPPAASAEPTPEEVVIIAAAVTAFLGKKVRVRGARRVLPAAGLRPGPSPWGLQGRVFIQASHALQRGGGGK